MDRRQAVRILGATAALTGLSPERLIAIVSSPARVPRRAFFTDEQREAVDAMAETIIPTTDTPGAIEAGVTDFIEIIVSEWYEPDQRERFMRGLAHVDEHAVALTGVRFAYAGPEYQTAILAGLEAEGDALMEARDAREPGSGEAELTAAAPTPYFHQLRGLVLTGYYTSEIGMREELLFRRIPGSFDGCVDVSEVTRA